MKRGALFCGLMLIFAGVASAQDEAPKAEVFAGYSFIHASTNGVGFNLNGGSASVAYNVTPMFGIVGDFGGYKAGSDLGNGTVYTYLFGPKIAYRQNAKFTPFVQALFGGAHASGGGGGGSVSENAFAMTVGGGLDWNATPHIGVRLIQAEYLMTRFNFGAASNRQNGARISAGVVFRF